MAKKQKWTPEELQEIFSRPFDLFPSPSSEAQAKGITKRKPLKWQELAFLFLQPWSKRLQGTDTLHCHNLDCLLAYSGSGTGKTAVGVALNMFFLINFPGCETLAIAEVYQDIEKIIIPKFKELLSIKEPWDSPYLLHVPNKQDKYLDLRIPIIENGEIKEWKISRCWLGHAADWERLRGTQYSYIHAEEISQFKEPRVLDEFSRRLRSSISPFRMLYATTNPPESMSHFMYNYWDLSSFIPDYEGKTPEPRACSCQFCPECSAAGLGDFHYEGNLCSNPDCAFKNFCIQEGLEPTPFKKPTWQFNGKTYSCPGNQKFWRVLHPQPGENIHNPSTMLQDLKAGHDEANYAVYVKGEVRALRSNRVYSSFSYKDNTFNEEVKVDPLKDIVWSHDHNVFPRCSVIVQERFEGENVFVDVIDEIVKYSCKDKNGKEVRGAGPEHVAEEFIERYRTWNQASVLAGEQKTVYLHGDHTALNNKMSPLSPNEFQIIHDLLDKAGFKVVVAVRKVKGHTQVTQADRVALTNWLLRDNNSINRIKINKSKCPHLLKSLEDLERKTNDKEQIDKSKDELARKATNLNVVYLISDISDALGYYLIRCFNLVQQGDVIKFIYIPGGSLLNIDFKEGRISEVPRNYPVLPEEKGTSQEELEKMYTEEYLQRIRAYLGQSVDNKEMDAINRFRGYFN